MSTVLSLYFHGGTNVSNSMAAAGLHPPDPTFAVNSGPMPKIWATHPAPVTTFVGTPPNPFQPTNTDLFAAQFSGVNTITCELTLCINSKAIFTDTTSKDAFSGAILFIAFLSEMRHPLDFWSDEELSCIRNQSANVVIGRVYFWRSSSLLRFICYLAFT